MVLPHSRTLGGATVYRQFPPTTVQPYLSEVGNFQMCKVICGMETNFTCRLRKARMCAFCDLWHMLWNSAKVKRRNFWKRRISGSQRSKTNLITPYPLPFLPLTFSFFLLIFSFLFQPLPFHNSHFSLPFVITLFQVENEDGNWLKLSREIVTKYCNLDTEAWTLAVGLSGRMFLAAEGDQSYLTQIAETKSSEAQKAAALFPTAASVFGTAQQSVFGTLVTPPTFLFGSSSKPVKLKFGSQESSSMPSLPVSPEPFKFGSPSCDGIKSAEKEKDKDSDAKNQKHSSGRSVPMLARISGRLIKRRKESQSFSEFKSDASEAKKDEDIAGEVKEDDQTQLKVEVGDEKREEEEEGVGVVDQKVQSDSINALPTKQALSPAVAECQRAVFAAFLWQESLVYDAWPLPLFSSFTPS